MSDDFAVDLGTINGAPLQAILNFDSESRISAAYHNDFLTVAVDFYLTENEPLLASSAFNDLTTQYVAAGAEFNAFDFMPLRVGAVKNVASGISDGAKGVAYTAGLGFWLGFNLTLRPPLTTMKSMDLYKQASGFKANVNVNGDEIICELSQ